MSGQLAPSNTSLLGRVVALTRSASDSAALASDLRDRGAEVLIMPAVEIAPPETWDLVDDAIEQVDRFDWIVFTSRNSVEAFFDRVGGARAPAMDGVRIAAVGPSTRDAIERRGREASLVPREATASCLAAALRTKVRDRRVLLPLGDLARPGLARDLREAGADVHEIIVYRTVAPDEVDLEVLDRVRRGTVDVLAFASPSAVNTVAGLLNQESINSLQAACIGPTTAAAARAAGFRNVIEASPPGTRGWLQAIIEGCRNRRDL